MKRYVFLSILFFGFLLNAEPYKPYPILFVHGLGGNSGAWGASTKDPKNDRSEWICKDSVDAHPEGTYSHFLPLMTPYAWAWYNWEVGTGNWEFFTSHFLLLSSHLDKGEK